VLRSFVFIMNRPVMRLWGSSIFLS